MAEHDEREADRLYLRASQLRLIADELEQRAAALRPSRTPYNPRTLYDQLFEQKRRSLVGVSPPGYEVTAFCTYCFRRLHPWDSSHEQNGDGFCIQAPTERCATIDHCTPIALGGTNDLGNLTLACKSCNSRKGARTYAHFQALRIVGLAETALASRPDPLIPWIVAFYLCNIAEYLAPDDLCERLRSLNLAALRQPTAAEPGQ